jgi:hypothetical protein
MKVRRILAGASTYLDNDTNPAPLESDIELRNNQAPMGLLIDPDEDFNQIETHFPVIASRKKEILADLLNDEAGESEDMPEEELDADAEELELTEEPDLDEEIKANEEAADNAAKMLSPDGITAKRECKAESFEDEADDAAADEDADVEAEAEADLDKEAVEADAEEQLSDEEEKILLTDQGMPAAIAADEPTDVVDIEAMDDADVEDIEFVEMPDETVIALKANRVIATLTKRAAIRAKLESVYTQPQFEAAARLEMKKHGLRAGLKNAGFTLSSYKISAKKALNLKVQASVKKLAASANKFKKEQREAMVQATAIACMGLNRGAFKGYKNELRAELVKNLRQAGLVNAERVVSAAFASKGVDYLRTVLALATKVQAMPEEVRDGFVEQLDMTEDQIEAAECEDCDQFGAPVTADEMEVEEQLPETVTAALAKPARKLTADAIDSDSTQFLKNREAVMPFGLY